MGTLTSLIRAAQAAPLPDLVIAEAGLPPSETGSLGRRCQREGGKVSLPAAGCNKPSSGSQLGLVQPLAPLSARGTYPTKW